MGLATILAVVAIVLALIALVLPFVVTHPTTNTTTQGTPNVNFYAVVAANGTLVRGLEVTNSTIVAKGTYIVTFNVSLFSCTLQGGFGTIGAFSAGAGVVTITKTVAPQNSTRNVTVTTYNNTNKSLDNQSFHVVATCPGGLWAVVGPKGSLLNGAGVQSSLLEGTGAYQVIFGQDVANCAYLGGWGSDLSSSPGGTLGLASRSGNLSGVWIVAYSTAGVATSTTFHLIVYC